MLNSVSDSGRLSDFVDKSSTQMMQMDGFGFIDKRWIERRTDEELARIISLASEEVKRRGNTLTGQVASSAGPIEFGEVTNIPLEDFITVPSRSGASLLSKSRTWHIILVSSDTRHPPLALKIVGDAVLGRKTEGTEPDIDLNSFDPAIYGVSRTHAMFRPMVDQLLLNDLGSTNGSSLDGEKLELNRAANLTDGCVISLGKLHLKVHIIRRPEDSVG